MNKARVIKENKTNYVIKVTDREYLATVRGTFFSEESFPKVGDYVIFSEVAEGKAVIEEILPRTSFISRKAVGADGEQIIVTNVDLILIVMGLDGDFNLSRLERYLLLAEQSGVTPVIILNKKDTVDSPTSFIESVQSVATSTPTHAISATTGDGMDSLLQYLNNDTTAVLLGSSGAGKSTITNWLLDKNRQGVSQVRADDSRGRHTTTARELFSLPQGGCLIDTPGMRELGVVSSEDEEKSTFDQIDELARKCQFTNCDHEKSKGCAVLEAVEKGEISVRQLHNFQKLQRERLFEESKFDDSTAREYKQNQKNLHKGYRQIQKRNRSYKEYD